MQGAATESLAIPGMAQTQAVKAVMPHLHSQSVVHIQAKPLLKPGLLGLPAADPATFLLLNLVAIDRIIQKTGEVGM
jgi:hypothetical protein